VDNVASSGAFGAEQVDYESRLEEGVFDDLVLLCEKALTNGELQKGKRYLFVLVDFREILTYFTLFSVPWEFLDGAATTMSVFSQAAVESNYLPHSFGANRLTPAAIEALINVF
jgi:hypothetical protein